MRRCVEKSAPAIGLPPALQMRDPARDEDEVHRAIAEGGVRDAQVATSRVMNVNVHGAVMARYCSPNPPSGFRFSR